MKTDKLSNDRCLGIHEGDIIRARGFQYEVTAEPYLPDDLIGDSAIDEEYAEGEYIIPVDSGGAVYESEVDEVVYCSNFELE